MSEEFNDFILVLFHYCFTLNQKAPQTLKIRTIHSTGSFCSSVPPLWVVPEVRTEKNSTHCKLQAGRDPRIQPGLRQVHGLPAPRLDPDVRVPVCGGICVLTVVLHPLADALHQLQEVSF